MNKLYAAVIAVLCISTIVVLATNDSGEPSSDVIPTVAALTQPNSGTSPNLPFLTNDESNNIAVFKNVGPSVVFVTNTKLMRQRFSLNVMELPRGSGTGFVWHESGLILTNYHVIHGSDKITITLGSGKTYEAEIVGIAPEKDVALLKIDAPNETLIPIPLGNSAKLSVGRKVLAIGNPFSETITRHTRAAKNDSDKFRMFIRT